MSTVDYAKTEEFNASFHEFKMQRTFGEKITQADRSSSFNNLRPMS